MKQDMGIGFGYVAGAFIRVSCLGVGGAVSQERPFPALPYEQAFALALQSSCKMH